MLSELRKIALCRSELSADRSLGLRVRGTSMVPALWPGDTVRVARMHARGFRAGDIAVFARGGQLVVHRVVTTTHGAGGGVLVTRGDAQVHTDAPVLPSEIVGVATAVRRFRGERPIAPARPLASRHVARVVRAWQVVRVLLGAARFRLARATPAGRRHRMASKPSR